MIPQENLEPKREVIGKLDEQRTMTLKILLLEKQNSDLKMNALRQELMVIQSRVQGLQKASAESGEKLDKLVEEIAGENKISPKEITINPETGDIFKMENPIPPPETKFQRDVMSPLKEVPPMKTLKEESKKKLVKKG